MTDPAPQVLLLGADGFIGRQIAATLRAESFRPLCSARRPARLAAMGYATLAADLADPATHDPAFWRPRLAHCAHVVNAAGLLTGSEAAFAAVHAKAPAAVYAALPPGATGVLICAVGIASATPFAAARRAGEAAALAEEARRAFRLWFALGWPAFAALVAVFWLMVTKPSLGF